MFLGATEIPLSFQIATGVAVIGAALRRNVYFDQVNHKVWPNTSILLVGPSGIGKDSAIDQAEKALDELGLPVIGGRTMEVILAQMLKLGDPACCVIPAPEVSAFMGGKDYQASMVQEITDLLSTKTFKNIATKTDGVRKIPNPTVTMLAGSTKEWLHKAMPDGSLEGGLWGRFLVVCEELGSKHVPLVAHAYDALQLKAIRAAYPAFIEGVREIIKRFPDCTEIPIYEEARYIYENWYINRFELFDPSVKPYANRSRDAVLRIAMICGLSRGHFYIEAPDVIFADTLLRYIAERISKALVPPTREAKVTADLLAIIKDSSKSGIAKTTLLKKAASFKHTSGDIRNGLAFLEDSGQVVRKAEAGVLKFFLGG